MDYMSLMQAAANAGRAKDYAAEQKLFNAAIQVERQRIEGGGTPRADAPTIFQGSAPRGDRFGDTIKAAAGEPWAATKAFAAGVTDPSRSPTAPHLPEFLPEGTSRVTDAAMTGVSGLATVVGGAAGLVGEVVGGSPSREIDLARDLVMASSVAVPELAGVSSTMRMAGAAGRAAKAGGKAPSPLAESARAADDLGVTPALGMGGKAPAMISAGLEKMPFAGTVIAKDAARAVAEIEGVASNVARRIGDAGTAESAGTTLQSGLLKFRDSFKAASSKRFDEVAKVLPPGTRVEIPHTLSSVAETRKFFAESPELAQKLGLNTWDNVLSEARENGMTWRALSQFRTSVGEGIGKISGPLKNEAQGRLSRLYATLTDDMEAAAQQAGGDAYKAWSNAVAYHKKGAQRIEGALDKTIKADSPERAFEAFARMAGEGKSSADIRRMQSIKASLTRDDWSEISASIVDRLGRSRPGQQNASGDAFSPSAFLTNWSGMSKEAQNLLVPPPVRKEITDLLKVAERARSAGAERNFSNTGTIIAQAGLVGAGLTHTPATTLSVLGGAALSAKFMTNASTLRALNKMARGDARQMRALANSKSPFAQDAATVLRITAAEAAATSGAANSPNSPMQLAR